MSDWIILAGFMLIALMIHWQRGDWRDEKKWLDYVKEQVDNMDKRVTRNEELEKKYWSLVSELRSLQEDVARRSPAWKLTRDIENWNKMEKQL
jgi:hypothetical protein